MKVSLKWLSEYVDVPSDIKEFCDRLDLCGTGVEGREKIGPTYDGVVVGHVLACIDHPNSDHMHVATVDVGQGEPLQIVCGASNIAADIKVAVATVGATLPDGTKIKKSKLRGVASCGMCCSVRELGIGSDHEGIWVLPNDAATGMPIADYLDKSDTVLDLEITPNRPDALSITGLAREVGAMYQRDWSDPVFDMAAKLKVSTAGPAVEDLVKVDIEDDVRCPRYAVQVIRGCKVGPSPDWLVERLAAVGQRSINNIVDATNYILFLLGQPLHAFDLNKLKGVDGVAHIVVRAAKDKEVLTTLDGERRELIEDMTVISTPEQGAVALAGVMGGLDSEVTDQSTDILLEVATFEAGRTSRTSRNLGLISESSMRYERGVDDNGIEIRAAAAAALIAEVSGGVVCRATSNDTGVVDVWRIKTEPRRLKFRISRFNAMMGANIPVDFIEDVLCRLGCTLAAKGDADTLDVSAPTFRPDLEREIDLYEEVVRLWGMDRIEPTLPGGPGRVGTRSEDEIKLDIVNDTLRASGLNETMTYSFALPDDLECLRIPTEGLGEPVELINPMNAEQSILRRSIIPGLLRSVAHNQAHGVRNIQLYEIGKTFHAAAGRMLPKERQKVAGVLVGSMHDTAWNAPSVPFDFFDGKGVVENLVRELAIPKFNVKPFSADAALHLQPGRAACLLSGGIELGWLGEIHPEVLAAFDVQGSVVAFELSLASLIKASQAARPYVDVPQFPAVSVDVAFLVDESVTNERLSQCIASAGGKLLEDSRLFDVYRDAKRVGENKKSVAYALTYRAADRTLTGTEVEKAHARLVKKVCAATGAEVRR